MSKVEKIFSISEGRKFLASRGSGRFLKPGFTVLLSVISLTAIAFAGSLTPPASPASTFHTLEEIYNSIAGTFDSSSISSSTTGSLIQGIKYINSNLAWASGSNNIWSLNTGNVGIGTTSPESKLHIRGSTPAITLRNTFLVNQTWQIRNGSTAAGSPNFDIYDKTASASRLVIQDDGNVMIGSASNPSNNSRVFIFGGTNGANVDVRGQGSVSDQATLELEGSDYDITPNSALLQYYGPNGTGTTMGFNNQRLGVLRFVSATTALIATNNNTPLIFGTTDAEKMRLDSVGRLAIGTTTPKSRFTIVDGNIGSTSSGSFAIRSSNTIGSVASISGTALVGGSIFNITLPASSSANNPHGLLLAQDTAGTVIASWSMGGKLALRSQIFSRGAVSTCTGVNTPTSGCVDYAESFPTNDPTLEAGDVVSVDATSSAYVLKATNTSVVLGVISTNPAALIDGNSFKTGAAAEVGGRNVVPVALAGRVPLKVSLENGEVQAGDHLGLSTTKPGYAAKAVTPGMTVGIALEPSDPSRQSDKVLTFINLDYWVPNIAMVSDVPAEQIIMSGGIRLDVGVIFNAIISRFEKFLGIVFKNGLVQSMQGVFGIVETDRLCVGNTCVTEKELIDLLQRANVPQAIPTTQPTATSTPIETPVSPVDPTPTPNDPLLSNSPTPSIEPTPDPSPTVIPTPTPVPTPPETLSTTPSEVTPAI